MIKNETPEAITDYDGIFLLEGGQVSISNFTINVGEDGQITSTLELHTGIDMCASWFRIALDRQTESDTAYRAVVQASRDKDDQGLGKGLKTDFYASLQAIMASAVALDAFYANLKILCNIDNATQQSWKNNRTARYRQVSEVLRLAYKLTPVGAGQVTSRVRDIFRFRDQAVHPDSTVRAPTYYPAINKGIDDRINTFRNRNSLASLWHCFTLINDFSGRAKTASDEIRTYGKSLSKSLSPLVAEWETRYGRPINEAPDLLREQVKLETNLHDEISP